MTPKEFIGHWSPGGGGFAISERAGAQPHFIGLCALLGVSTPDDAENYTFEKGTLKLGAKRGFADVFKRGAFAWEYKAPNGDLQFALRQLKDYANALDSPPPLIVSDRLRIEVHTQFIGRPTEAISISITQLANPRSFKSFVAFFSRHRVSSRSAPIAMLRKRPPKPSLTLPSACETSVASRRIASRISSRNVCSVSSPKT